LRDKNFSIDHPFLLPLMVAMISVHFPVRKKSNDRLRIARRQNWRGISRMNLGESVRDGEEQIFKRLLQAPDGQRFVSYFLREMC
jgi:hypothetical protein